MTTLYSNKFKSLSKEKTREVSTSFTPLLTAEFNLTQISVLFVNQKPHALEHSLLRVYGSLEVGYIRKRCRNSFKR